MPMEMESQDQQDQDKSQLQQLVLKVDVVVLVMPLKHFLVMQFKSFQDHLKFQEMEVIHSKLQQEIVHWDQQINLIIIQQLEILYQLKVYQILTHLEPTKLHAFHNDFISIYQFSNFSIIIYIYQFIRFFARFISQI